MPPNAPRLLAVPLPPPYLLPRSLLRRSITPTQKRCMGIRSIDRQPKYSPYNIVPGLDPLHSTPAAALQRKLVANSLPLRTGALATKKGMTAMYDESGKRIPCTVLQLDGNQVVSHKTRKRHGYYAVCVGSGTINTKNVTKPMLGHYSVQGVNPKRHQKEFRVRGAEGLLPVGEQILADWFQVGQYVDTRSNCKGKGFAGPMKRWGFKGQPRTHGHSLSHRSHGSMGPSQGGGSRVYPGKKMAGNMGGQRNTVQSLKVLQSDADNGIVVVHGAVSGPNGTLVMLQDALKKPWIEPPPRVSKTPVAEAVIAEAATTKAEPVKIAA